MAESLDEFLSQVLDKAVLRLRRCFHEFVRIFSHLASSRRNPLSEAA